MLLLPATWKPSFLDRVDPHGPFPFSLQATLTGNGFPWLYAQKEGA